MKESSTKQAIPEEGRAEALHKGAMAQAKKMLIMQGDTKRRTPKGLHPSLGALLSYRGQTMSKKVANKDRLVFLLELPK